MDLLNFGVDIGTGLVSAGIGALIAWGTTNILKYRRLRKLKAFWKGFNDGEVTIIFGDFGSKRGWEISGLMGVGDAMALSQVRNVLDLLRVKDYSYYPANRVPGEQLKNNLILIGGPDANEITRKVSSSIDTTIKFGDPEIHEIQMYDSLKNKYYVPTGAQLETNPIVDYGLIINSINPLNTEKSVMILAGSFGFGSWACAESVSRGDFLSEKPIRHLKQNKEILIKTEVIHGWPQSAEIVEARNIAQV